MEPQKKPIQKNDNKILKETGAKDLLTAVLQSAGKSLSKHEKTIVEEFLLHGKTFSELKGSRWWPASLQKRLFNNGVNKLINKLREMDNKLLECESKHKEVSKIQAELAHTTLELEKLGDILKAKTKLKPEIQEFLSTPIMNLAISSRIKNGCEAIEVHTLHDLVRLKKSEFLAKRNFGKKSADELEVFLKLYGLSWNMNV